MGEHVLGWAGLAALACPNLALNTARAGPDRAAGPVCAPGVCGANPRAGSPLHPSPCLFFPLLPTSGHFLKVYWNLSWGFLSLSAPLQYEGFICCVLLNGSRNCGIPGTGAAMKLWREKEAFSCCFGGHWVTNPLKRPLKWH